MSHLLTVAYHYVIGPRSEYFQGLKGVTEKQFGDQLDRLAGRYSFIAPEDVAECPWQDGTPRCLITFDDGTKDHALAAAPALQDRGIRALFFVTTGILAGESVIPANLLHLLLRESTPRDIADAFNASANEKGLDVAVDLERPQSYYKYDDPVTASLKYQLNHVISSRVTAELLPLVFERVLGSLRPVWDRFYMNAADMASLERSGHVIAAHSHGHFNLARASSDERRADVARAAQVLRDNGFSSGRLHFAVPFGGSGAYSDEVLGVLRAAGFRFVYVNDAALTHDCDGIIHRHGTKQLPPFVDRWPEDEL